MEASWQAMEPSSAWEPVATTTPVALPSLTMVPIRAHDLQSTTLTALGSGATLFFAGLLSPVRADSSHEKSSTFKRRTSAGTTSPSYILTMSPGTRDSTFTSENTPSLRQEALWEILFLRESAVRWLLHSLKVPIAKERNRITHITIPPLTDCRKKLKTPVTNRRIMMGSFA